MDWYLQATGSPQNLTLKSDTEVHDVVMRSLCLAGILIVSKRTNAAQPAANYYLESANARLQTDRYSRSTRGVAPLERFAESFTNNGGRE